MVDISKEEWRLYAKKLRSQIKDKKAKDFLIFKNVLRDKHVKDASKILIYVALPDEVATKDLILEFLTQGKRVYVPKIVSKEMLFYNVKSLEELRRGTFNILEPTSNELFLGTKGVIIVPGLLFDKKNNRLGYGGGYYDKFLVNKNFYKIGLCYFDLVTTELEVSEHDIKMDKVITER